MRSNRDFTHFAASAAACIHPNSIGWLSTQLGVSCESLVRLGIGEVNAALASEFDIQWELGVWTFPMRDAGGNVVGVRIRRRRGQKRAVAGSRQGLFLPTGLESSIELLICEGTSDAAAMLDLGFTAIGRPSCSEGAEDIHGLLRRHSFERVVIIADSDAPGQTGARALADRLADLVTDLRIVTPPIGMKDAREWKCAGATRSAVEAAIRTAETSSVSAIHAGPKSLDGGRSQ